MMPQNEIRTAISLSAVYMIRMLGLFMIIPVLPLYLDLLPNTTPLLIGMAIGVYGLTQAALQIPFGILSDKVGRKPVIIAGLLLFLLGSIVAALSEQNIFMIILGRTLQGMGAIAAVTMALAADLSSPQNRSKIMAFIGVSIGVAFITAMIIGPLIDSQVGIQGVFWFTAILAIIAIFIVLFVVPTPKKTIQHADAGITQDYLIPVLNNPSLLRMNVGVFLLHLLMTSNFIVLPLLLINVLHILPAEHWQFYTPVFVLSFMFSLPLIIAAERKRKVKAIFLFAIGLLAVAQVFQGFYQHHPLLLISGFFLFFVSFNFLEAIQPSLVAKYSRVYAKGTAMGVFTTSQFIGIFVGGILGGSVYQLWGATAVFFMGVVIALIWLVVIKGLPQPEFYQSLIIRLRQDHLLTPSLTEKNLKAIAGVMDVSVAAESGLAYLKVDKDLVLDDQLALYGARV